MWFRKIVLHHKIINKTPMTKNHENLVRRFGDNYLRNYLVIFLQDRIEPSKVRALRICTGYHIL